MTPGAAVFRELSLIFHFASFRSISEAEYVPTGQLREFLIQRGIAGFDEPHQFRSGVIARLRDRGVLLASSSKGYKIPASIPDLLDFVELTDTVVHPMPGRLETVRVALPTQAGMSRESTSRLSSPQASSKGTNSSRVSSWRAA
jgi:hypothetical protein